MNHADPHDRFGRTFAERLGGRWLVSWPTFIIGGLFSSLVLFRDIITANRTNDQYEMLAWWLLALIAAASISYLEHRTVLRHRATKPVSIWSKLPNLFLLRAKGSFFAINFGAGKFGGVGCCCFDVSKFNLVCFSTPTSR
jgi:hypothetical protein